MDRTYIITFDTSNGSLSGKPATSCCPGFSTSCDEVRIVVDGSIKQILRKVPFNDTNSGIPL